jgi:hypothetical protein
MSQKGSTPDRLKEQLRQLQAEGLLAARMSCVTQDGVFFGSEHYARVFAERHNKELVRIDGEVPGWLARNKRPK